MQIADVTIRHRADIRDIAYDFSHQWFLDEKGHDVFAVDDMPFGLLSQLYVYETLVGCLADEQTGRETPPVPTLSWEALVVWLKNARLDWQVKEHVSRALVWLRRTRPTSHRQVDCLFVYDVFNPGMIDTLLAVQRCLPQKKSLATLSFEPRVYRRVAGEDRNDHYLYPGRAAAKHLDEAEQLHAYLFDRYCEHRNRTKDRVRSLLSGTHERFMRHLDAIMRRFYRQLCRDYFRIQAFLDGVGPRRIVMGSDAHKFSRLITLLARRRGVETLVIQHGATIGRHAYVPVYADRMAVWGTISRQWFMENRVAPDRLVVTGQPRLDRLVNYRKTEAPGKADKCQRFRVVLATNDLLGNRNDLLMKTVCQGVRPLSEELDLVMKLHPGERNHGQYTRFARRFNLNWTIVSKGDLYELLVSADTVITAQSTVGIEALAMGLPLIIVEVPGVPKIVPYDRYECAMAVHDAAGLTTAMGRLMAKTDDVKKLSQNADRFIADYLYRLDGKAAQRVADLIMDEKGSYQRTDDSDTQPRASRCLLRHAGASGRVRRLRNGS